MVAGDNRVDQRQLTPLYIVQSAAVVVLVLAERAALQRRTVGEPFVPGIVQATAVTVRTPPNVVDERAAHQRQIAVIVHAAAVAGRRVGGDGGVGQVRRGGVPEAAAVAA